MKKILLWVMIIGVLGYLGACGYANYIAKPEVTTTNPEMPDTKDAAYSLLVVDSGTVILTNKYEMFGDTVKQRTYVLHGYWEQVGNKFLYRKDDIILNEKFMGEIKIGVRK